MSDYKLLVAGDTALVVEFGNRIDLQLSTKVVALARCLNELRIKGVTEIVPTIRSLIIYYEPLILTATALEEYVRAAVHDLPSAESTGRLWQLPVCYNSAVAPDLSHVAEQTGLSTNQVIERHCAVTYYVYMLGFLPGLAYLGDVPDELALRRRESPRGSIPAGSLGIAGNMTCIYPMKTPCGWHLIGRSPVQLWDLRRQMGALLAAGDQVELEPVSLREYERLLERAALGTLQIASRTADLFR
jgi:KipI family sensor histidine kinase inhibitor